MKKSRVLRHYSKLVRLPLPNGIWAKLMSPLHFSGGSSSLRWDHDHSTYVLSQRGKELRIPRRNRLRMSYSGLDKRLQLLRDEYGLDLIPLQAGDLAIDVGANIGEVTMVLQDKGLQVLSFEPDPVEYGSLVLNSKTPERCYPVALSNEDGQAVFFLKNNHGDSSLLQPPSHSGETIQVTTSRLDSILEPILSAGEHSTVKLLKLEAEGAEPEILQGAELSLPRVEWISADVGFERGKEGESTLPAVLATLAPFGFELQTLLGPRLVAIFKNTRLVKAQD